MNRTFLFTLGIYPGYNHGNKMPDGTSFTEEEIYTKFMDILERVCDKPENCDVSFVVSPARVIYRKKYGCNSDGEVVYKFEATYNKEYGVDVAEWTSTCYDYAMTLKDAFNQSTLTLARNEIYTGKTEYLK